MRILSSHLACKLSALALVALFLLSAVAEGQDNPFGGSNFNDDPFGGGRQQQKAQPIQANQGQAKQLPGVNQEAKTIAEYQQQIKQLSDLLMLEKTRLKAERNKFTNDITHLNAMVEHLKEKVKRDAVASAASPAADQFSKQQYRELISKLLA